MVVVGGGGGGGGGGFLQYLALSIVGYVTSYKLSYQLNQLG